MTTVRELREQGAFPISKTEDMAIRFLEGYIWFQRLKSIGMGTAGYLEGYFTERGKRVTATSLDKQEIEYTKGILKDIRYYSELTIKQEDVRKKMRDRGEKYDVLYSRLCMDSLSDTDLKKALAGCYRILKSGGSFIIIVKSSNDWTAKTDGAWFEEETGFTHTPNIDCPKKRLHTRESITQALERAGFFIYSIHEQQEEIYPDYVRTYERQKATLWAVYASK